MADTTFSEPSADEQAWIRSQLEGARLFVEAHSPADVGQPVTLEALDRAFAAWLAGDPGDTTEINAAVNAVGTCFGQFLVDEAGFNWVIATDEQGTDLAVLALPGRGDVLVYPANFVAKRWERRESGFLARSFAQMRAQVDAIAGSHTDEPRRPWWKVW